MRPYNIVILAPPSYEHWQAFVDVGRLLHYSLIGLGFPCKLQVNRFRTDSVNVVLGYNLLRNPDDLPAVDYVVYQLEQLSDSEGWFRDAQLEIFRRARAVWDYAPENIEFLSAKGIDNVRHLPIGFDPGLCCIRHEIPEVDVLFYGALNRRRQAVLTELGKICEVKSLLGVYGEERDDWIARAKIVLNVHFYAAQVMEQVRISYLLNNRRFVVSEQSPKNPYQGGIVTAAYEELAERCREYLDDGEARDRIAAAGYSLLGDRPMAEYLKQVL